MNIVRWWFVCSRTTHPISWTDRSGWPNSWTLPGKLLNGGSRSSVRAKIFVLHQYCGSSPNSGGSQAGGSCAGMVALRLTPRGDPGEPTGSASPACGATPSIASEGAGRDVDSRLAAAVPHLAHDLAQTRSRSTAQYDSVGSFRSRLPQKSLISNRRNSGGRSRKKTTVPRRRERERRGEGRRSTRTQPQALRAAGPLERRRRECGARRCSRVGAWLSRELGVEAAVEIWRSLTSRTVRAPASLRYACRPRQ